MKSIRIQVKPRKGSTINDVCSDVKTLSEYLKSDMGFFSWKTNDTNRSICNSFSSRKPFTVYMLDNKGNKWKEDDYEGYGIFGGKDFYELLAEMNGKDSNRDTGIDLFFNSKEDILFPMLVENPNTTWRNEKPEDCEYQGFFYDNEDEAYEEEYD